MLSKKRVRTKSNTRTKSKRITKSRNLNKKRVKRVSTKQRGGVKRRRTKKSKKKSQKGGNESRISVKAIRNEIELNAKISQLKLSSHLKEKLKNIATSDIEFVNNIINIINDLENKQRNEVYDKILDFIDKIEVTDEVFGFNNNQYSGYNNDKQKLQKLLEMSYLVTHVFFRLFGFNIDMIKLYSSDLKFYKSASAYTIDKSYFNIIYEAIETYKKYTDCLLNKKKGKVALNKDDGQSCFITKTSISDESLEEFYYSEDDPNNMPIDLAGLVEFEGFPESIKKGLHTKIKGLLENCVCKYGEDESGEICQGVRGHSIPTFYALFFYKLLQQGVITKISADTPP